MEADNIIWEQHLLYGAATVIKRENDGYYTVYKMNCPDGYGIRRVYRVFPGLDLVYDAFNTTNFPDIAQAHNEIKREIIELSYCRKGRLECEFRNGLYVYMGKGDFFAGMVNEYPGANAFPMENYQGISVYLYPDTLSRRAPQLLKDAAIDIYEIKNRLLPETVCFRRAEDRIERVFLDLYHVPESIRKAYLELKAIELLLLLSVADYPEKNEPQEYYPRQQVEIIKCIQKQITGDIRRHYTIEELAAEHGISRTALKSCFKGVYGASIGAYMKEYRMKCSAAMLRQANSSVSDIASRVGYENQSKFAKAFRESYGLPPLKYRQSMSWDT